MDSPGGPLSGGTTYSMTVHLFATIPLVYVVQLSFYSDTNSILGKCTALWGEPERQ